VLPKLIVYTSPRACSSACHIALEESGLDYDVEIVRVREGRHREPAYLAINAWGKLPALRVGEETLTEAHAILSLVGDLSDRALLPSAPLARARAHEWMNFLSATVHIAFRPLFRPQLLVDDDALYPRLLDIGIPALRKALSEVDRRLAGRHWALGNAFSVVDPYLLVFWIWSQRDDVRPYAPDMPNWRAHAERVFDRPATWRCLNREGVTPDNIADP
jgi:glutathione S-transferase